MAEEQGLELHLCKTRTKAGIEDVISFYIRLKTKEGDSVEKTATLTPEKIKALRTVKAAFGGTNPIMDLLFYNFGKDNHLKIGSHGPFYSVDADVYAALDLEKK